MRNPNEPQPNYEQSLATKRTLRRWGVATLYAVPIAGALVYFVIKPSDPTPTANASPAVAVASPETAHAAQASAPTQSPLEVLLTRDRLADVLALTTPYMKDTTGELDRGAALLTGWVAQKGRWPELMQVKETSLAAVAKDPEAERGRRLCASGTVVEIHAAKPEDFRYFSGNLVTNSYKVVSFLATRSTGTLVQNSVGRFCGIVTGTNDYPNSAGGTSHAVRAVGMFDLPENRSLK